MDHNELKTEKAKKRKRGEQDPRYTSDYESLVHAINTDTRKYYTKEQLLLIINRVQSRRKQDCVYIS